MGLTESTHFFFPARRFSDCRGRQGVKARRGLPQGSLEAMAASAKLLLWLESWLSMIHGFSFFNLGDAVRPEEDLPGRRGQPPTRRCGSWKIWRQMTSASIQLSDINIF